MPTSHPSGWAHADGALSAVRPGGPHWLREPADANTLVPILWSSTAAKDEGVLSVGGVIPSTWLKKLRWFWVTVQSSNTQG